MKLPTAHLIHGFVGAGKTTFAKKLEKEIGAKRFTPDEWMVARYGHNPPPDKYSEFEQIIISDIKKQVAQILLLGKDVILDFGFWKRQTRDEIRNWVKVNKAVPRFYSIICPEELMRKRVLARTEGDPNALWIDDNAFELFKQRFEPMQQDEEFSLVST